MCNNILYHEAQYPACCDTHFRLQKNKADDPLYYECVGCASRWLYEAMLKMIVPMCHCIASPECIKSFEENNPYEYNSIRSTHQS